MGETLCRGHWNDWSLGNVWCTNCTCFWFPPQLTAVWPWHPGKFLPISGGQSARRYLFSEGWRTGMVQILTVIGWHQAPGMGHAAGRLPAVLPLSTETHSSSPSGLPISSWPAFCGLGQAGLTSWRAVPLVLTLGVQRWSFASCLLVAMLHGLWDLCSPTRDWTHTLCTGSLES